MARKNDHSYFANKECPYYPCHKTADESEFNCLFCYCPLYALGDRCGGNFCYMENGVKDCSNCLVPHSKGGYDYIIKNFPKIAEMAAKKTE